MRKGLELAKRHLSLQPLNRTTVRRDKNKVLVGKVLE